jgi:NAD(P)-dependent dehydrogenase (short-subunit alcohol dehydrogenase family)/acyl carrier protein
MLGLDADLEGDLGIDSIKRVEIAGTFTEELAEPVRAAIDMEELTASRTLRTVIDVLETAIAGHPPPDGATPASAPAAAEERPFEHGPAEEERIGRFVVQPASAPEPGRGQLAAAGAVVILDDGRGVGAAVATALSSRGEEVLCVPPGQHPQDPAQALQIAERARAQGGAKAIVHAAALGDPIPEHGGVQSLLLLVQALEADLEAAAAAGGSAVLAATPLAGALAPGAQARGAAEGGALNGFMKTLALELPAVRVRCVDLPDAAPATSAERLLVELTADDDLIEVGYPDGRRSTLALVPAPLGERPQHVALDERCVVLLTGGARGITAQVALALAERHRPRLVLVGRTEPREEDAATAGLSSAAELRAALIEARRSGGPLTPALVEADLRRILAAREVRANLERLRGTGAEVEYHACDVGDRAVFSALIESIYERHGRIDGVVHGAGLIEDRLIREKRIDSLERVLAAKAGAARTLAETLRPADLRFLVLFSSVSGRFGNRGQADYAAASESLARLAHELDARWPARVVAVDWGPWRSTGMVSPELEREFARRGVALIDVEVGCRLLEQELSRGRKGEPEVVIGAASGLAGDAAGPAGEPAGSAAHTGEPQEAHGSAAAGSLLPLLVRSDRIAPGAADEGQPDTLFEAGYTFRLARDRYLSDHRIDDRAVVPFAVAMELMGEAALAGMPGAGLDALREIRLLDGVALDDDGEAPVRIRVAPVSAAEVDVVIEPAHGGRAHYRARAQLSVSGAQAPDGVAAPAALAAPRPFPVTVEEAYRELLFHGPLFQGIDAIEAIDDGGTSAVLHGSRPAACVAGAAGRWLLDPVLIDSALQVQVLWARLQWDVTLLPAEIRGYRRLGEAEQDEPVRHELRVRPGCSAPMCRADHWFYGADGRPLALLEDVVGVGSRALNRLAGVRA